VRVGTALDLVSALAAGEGLALVGVPVFGVWGPPAEAHDLPAFWASRMIARAKERLGMCPTGIENPSGPSRESMIVSVYADGQIGVE
jgi:hypothetical protein